MLRVPFLFIVLFFSYCSIQAQQISVSAHIDSTVIAIGAQTALTFEINQDVSTKTSYPVFSDTLLNGIEIVEPLKIDSVKTDNGRLLIKHKYIITSFDDSLYYIPPYPFVFQGDTIWSKSLSLKVVQPFQIDTTSAQVADIKNVMEPLINWKSIARITLIVLLFIIAFLWGLYFFKKYKKKGKNNENSIEELQPASIIILTKLDKLKAEKAWQNNRSKEYHTALTDAIRAYIERIFDLPCMEMTSEEIIEHLNYLRFENKKAHTALLQILKLADLVKFAKWEASPGEHELSLSNAYEFVNETKVNEELKEQNQLQNTKESQED